MKITATIVFEDLEGGFWGLIDDTGNKYYPIDGVPAEFQTRGLRVEATVERSNAVTFVMWGRPVHLQSISRL